MGDLVNRQDVISEIHVWFKLIELNDDILIDNINSLQGYDAPQWTPLTKKTKPDPYEKVYIQTKYGEHDRLAYIPPGNKYKSHKDGYFGSCDGDYFGYDFNDVVAWMQLPEDFKSKDEDWWEKYAVN